MRKQLPNVTLIGVDCLDIGRLKLAADICQKDFEFGATKLLTSLPDADPRVVGIDRIGSYDAYSRFCIRRMADYVETEFALLIQHDGFILNPDAWTDEFLEYDYIGSPWWYADAMNVGNGGFSLRSKKLLDILKAADFITEYDPEDYHICRTHRQELEALAVRYAPQALAERWGKEGVGRDLDPRFDNVWNGEFGFHGLQKTDISKWLREHPEYPDIRNVLKEKYLR